MILDWIGNNLLALATVGLAVVAVATTRWTVHHDSRERTRERRYARILQAQAALRVSVNMAGEMANGRSWRSKLVPIIMATYIGVGTVTRRWEYGKSAELLTMIATSYARDSAVNREEFAFVRSAYDVAGILVQIGPEMPADVIERLRQANDALLHVDWWYPRRLQTSLQEYVAAATKAHGELDRLIREERLEGRSRRRKVLGWNRLGWRRRSH